MNRFSIDCATCHHTAELPADALFVELEGTDQQGDHVAGWVQWICSTCMDLVRIPVGWATLLALVTAGVSLVDEDVAELRAHPESPGGGVPFTTDDLLDLHERLESATWFEDLACSIRLGTD